MTQDTNIENLIINKLTKAQYESIANPDPAQLYFITDEVISSSDVVNALGYTPENVANKTTTLSSSSTDTQYPSAKAVYDQIANIDTLPSQTGQSGKFLTTDGTDASWGNLPVATASTVGVVKPDNASIRVDNNGTLSAICRNVGEIISSTLPLTDAGLHLLDGSLLQYGIYKEFIDYIAELHTSNPNANYFCTETEWQTSVTTYGSCGKFVYDSVNNTVRLPKLGNQLIHNIPSTLGVKGNGMTLGLQGKIRDSDTSLSNFGLSDGGSDLIARTVAYGTLVGTSHGAGDDPANNYGLGVTTDPTKSGIVAETNNINTADVYYYVVIATSTKTDIQVDIDEIATDLNGKADTDLTNVTNAGYIKMAKASMPSNRFINLTLGASGSTYTAPANGWFTIRVGLSNGFLSFNNNSNSAGFVSQHSGGNALTIPMLKGQELAIEYSNLTSIVAFKFIYAVGSESEAS